MKTWLPALRRALRNRRRRRRGARYERSHPARGARPERGGTMRRKRHERSSTMRGNRQERSSTMRGNRHERSSQARRRRARAHLEHRRGLARRSAGPGRVPVWLAASAAGISIALGTWAAPALLRAMAGGESAPELVAITVLGHERLAPAEVAAATAARRGQALQSVDVAAVVASLESHPWIRSAEAVALPTGRLVVRVEERQPLATLLDAGDPGLRWVDGEGVPFAPAAEPEAESMPRLLSRRSFVTGEASPLLAEAVTLALEIPRRGLPGPARLELPDTDTAAAGATGADESKGWVLRTRHGSHSLEAVLGWGDTLPARLDRLAWLLATDLDVTRAASVVDLRFEDQAVLRPPDAGSASRGGG